MKNGQYEKPLGEKEFIAGFHAIGEERYHHKHPFHLLMHEGKLTRGQLQAYVLLVSRTSHLEAVASSLTELFSKTLISLRMDRMREHYPWLVPALEYFKGRLTQAPEDAEFALAYCVKHARTREQQELAYGALRAKCDILWAQLDALHFAYVNPGWPPPGAFQPAKEV